MADSSGPVGQDNPDRVDPPPLPVRVPRQALEQVRRRHMPGQSRERPIHAGGVLASGRSEPAGSEADDGRGGRAG